MSVSDCVCHDLQIYNYKKNPKNNTTNLRRKINTFDVFEIYGSYRKTEFSVMFNRRMDNSESALDICHLRNLHDCNFRFHALSVCVPKKRDRWSCVCVRALAN